MSDHPIEDCTPACFEGQPELKLPKTERFNAEPSTLFQFFKGFDLVASVWADVLEYNAEERVYIAYVGKERRWFMLRESITHFRRLRRPTVDDSIIR
jgi:hypothetical protein